MCGEYAWQQVVAMVLDKFGTRYSNVMYKKSFKLREVPVEL